MLKVFAHWCLPEGSLQSGGRLKISDVIISKPFLLLLSWTLMTLTIYLGRNSFLAHVFGVTYLLLIILYKINSLYGKFANPHYRFFIIVLGGGVAHAIVPIVGHYIQTAMFVHLGICFVVHILHLTECYMVFKDITFKDEEFIKILWAVNIGEMIVNIVFVFDKIFSQDHYIACSLAVQTMGLMIVNLNLKAEASPIDEYSVNSISSNENTNLFDTITMYIKRAFKFVDGYLMSRTVLMSIGSAGVILLTVLPNYRYLVFMVVLSIIMRLAVRKVDKVSPIPSITFLLDKALMVAPFGMLLFTLLAHFAGLRVQTGIVLTLVFLIFGLGLMFFALFTITDGNCPTVPNAFLILVTSTVTSIIYLLQPYPTREMQLFASLTIATSLLFFLSRISVSSELRAMVGAANAKVRPLTTVSKLAHHSTKAKSFGTSVGNSPCKEEEDRPGTDIQASIENEAKV
jgi:hypothetical protein